MDSVRGLATRRKVVTMRLFEINDEGQFEYTQDDYAALGKRIQEVRKARKLSQNELADMVAGCNRKRISSIENGSPTITVGELFCIAMELEESANYLITGCRADYPPLLTDYEEENLEWQRQYLIQGIVRLIEQLPHEKLVEIRNEAGDMLRSKN